MFLSLSLVFSSLQQRQHTYACTNLLVKGAVFIKKHNKRDILSKKNSFFSRARLARANIEHYHRSEMCEMFSKHGKIN